MHHMPQTMNNDDNKILRRNYVIRLNELIREGKHLHWLDETNFNLFCRRSQGRSRAGTRAVLTLPPSRGPNIHLIGVVSGESVLKFTIRRGAFKSVDCNEWVATLLQDYARNGGNLDNMVLICDNAPCHSRLENVFNGTGAQLLRLGPYSPMLNPLENLWSVVKQGVKRTLVTPNVQPPNVGEQRLAYLEDVVRQSIELITPGHCLRSYQHSTTFHGAVLALEDVDVG